ncbi:hypothetical protein ACR8AL_09200 [Clavibacter sepedonicus]|uniref:Uncharacterized protein n=1 Tax=Clavibacter sepedonicus TaxID=31964 RepID=B0RJ35_CLASE|nr:MULTISPECIES: hypothetical protein [Clavibacter]MBD5382706.1 hypothetical protein [Clavibacter sp.]OQJ45076.1 hypothetical protein B5P19_15930 [Clavibacter sepedonicus]OQJ50900.1 hypothetical protein B5P20_15820 [Clavibacter sepedonicus]UUK67302.1 hypothetical protein LRE50_16210 [Clavibacter sepedonicus]CAQ03224.1 hypothetical protein pCS0041 [Clavibacter sepedonicus]
MSLLLHVYVYREGSYWIVAIPAMGAVTQARSTSEIRLMARECTALLLDVPLARVRIGAVRRRSQSQVEDHPPQVPLSQVGAGIR